MAKDFRASQVETSKLILSGGLGKDNLGLAVYSGSIATDRAGTVSDATMLSKVGKDTTIFVSGTIGSKDGTIGGGTIFGGDLIVSGVLLAGGEEFHSHAGGLSVGGTISGSIHHTSGGISYLRAGTNTTIVSESNGQITISTTGGAANAFSTIAVADDGGSSSGANSTADSSTDTLTLVAGSGITLTNSSGGDDRIKIESTGGAQWTDTGQTLHPADSTGAENVVIGGTTMTNADIVFKKEGGATFNEQGGVTADHIFRVEASAARRGGLLVDPQTRQVVILGDGLAANTSYGLNAATSPLPTDIGVYISGSCGQADVLGSYGTTVIAGDLVVSGNFKTIKCVPEGGGSDPNDNMLEFDPGGGPGQPGSVSVGSMDGNAVSVTPGGAVVAVMPDDLDIPSLTVVNSRAEGVLDGARIGSIVGTTLDNNGGLTATNDISTTSPSTFIEFRATENHTNTAGGGSMILGGQTAGLNSSNSGQVWLDLGSPGPFMPDRPYVAGPGNNAAALMQVGTTSSPVNMQMMGGYIYGLSPVKFSMTGSTTATGFYGEYGNHLAMMITGSIYVSGSGAPGGTISGSIHHTREGKSYLIGGSGITIASASNGQITVTATGGGSVRTVGVDTDGNGSTDSTLGGGESLILKAGTNMTLAEAEGVVTFNASGGGGSSTLDQAYDQGGTGAGRFITADGGPVQIDASGDALAGLAITGSSGGNLIDFKVADNLNATIKHTSDYDLVIQNTGAGVSSTGHIIIDAVGPNANVILGNTTNMTKLVFNGHEATQPSSPYIYTSTGGNNANLVFDVPNNQSVVINEDAQSSDFRVESNALQSAILVDGGEDTVVLGSGVASYSALPADAKGTDVNVVISGSAGSRGTGTGGTLLAAGDVVISGSLIVGNSAAGASPGGTISGSIHHTRDGLSYLVAGTGVTIASASNGQVTIGTAGGGGSFSQFFIEDGLGVEKTIDNDKELKIFGGAGIDTKFGAGTGSDASPFDLELGMTGSVMTATYSQDGPHTFLKAVADVYEDSNVHLGAVPKVQQVMGETLRFQQDAPSVTHAVGLRTTIPKGATKLTIIVNGKGESTATGRVELRIAARLHPQSGCALGNNLNSSVGSWTSVLNDNGWLYFGNGSGVNTNAAEKYITMPGNTHCKAYRSPQFAIGAIVNNADANNIKAGSVMDIILCRNASTDSSKLINNTSEDHHPGDNDASGYNADFQVTYIQLEYK